MALARVLSISSPLPFFSLLAMYMTLLPILKIVLWSRKYSADGEPSLLSLIQDLVTLAYPLVDDRSSSKYWLLTKAMLQ